MAGNMSMESVRVANLSMEGIVANLSMEGMVANLSMEGMVANLSMGGMIANFSMEKMAEVLQKRQDGGETGRSKKSIF